MDNVTTKWQDAHVGSDSEKVSFRTTEQEKERLEQLRRKLRLTSKGQVIRAALDLLELAAIPGTFITEGRKGLADNADTIRKAKARFAPEAPSASAGGLPASDAPDSGEV